MQLIKIRLTEDTECSNYIIIINNTENATMHTDTAKTPTRLVLKALANQPANLAFVQSA